MPEPERECPQCEERHPGNVIVNCGHSTPEPESVEGLLARIREYLGDDRYSDEWVGNVARQDLPRMAEVIEEMRGLLRCETPALCSGEDYACKVCALLAGKEKT